MSDWRSHQQYMVSVEDEPPQPRLVINLSVAWDGDYGGPYGDGGVRILRPSVRAVHAAITHAVCRGAFVVAAAGNDPGGPAPVHGAMYPAGWETKPAPTSAQCDSLEGAGYNGQGLPIFPQPDGGTAPYWPLVYAVGGVRADDEPLANMRPGGRPRLAAPGSHAVAVDDSNGVARPTDILTGTSASTAVEAGIAATVWGCRPGLTVPELMAYVRQSATDLNVPADFCLEGSACALGTPPAERSIRRVSLCHALKAACTPRAGNCPPEATLLACTSRPKGSGVLPQLSAGGGAGHGLPLPPVLRWAQAPVDGPAAQGARVPPVPHEHGDDVHGGWRHGGDGAAVPRHRLGLRGSEPDRPHAAHQRRVRDSAPRRARAHRGRRGAGDGHPPGGELGRGAQGRAQPARDEQRGSAAP